MKPYRAITNLLAALSLLTLLAACAEPSTSSAGNAPTPTPQPTATATPKPKPTGLPDITPLYCQQVMTVNEANNLIHPPAFATRITSMTSANNDIGACLYMAGTTPTLTIGFASWSGTAPVAQADITSALTRFTGMPDFKVQSATPVSGVGDQAAYVAATTTYQGKTVTAHVFSVLYGKLLFGCFTSGSDAAASASTQSQLQQCAEQVLSRL